MVFFISEMMRPRQYVFKLAGQITLFRIKKFDLHYDKLIAVFY